MHSSRPTVNKARHGDVYSIAASPPFRSRACWRALTVRRFMAITNDRELRDASRKAGELLQEIQDYCGRKLKDDAKVRFPRGYLRTASSQRERLSFVADEDLKSNLAY